MIRRATARQLVLTTAAFCLGGCGAAGVGPAAPGPEPGPEPETARGVPGFDTRDYPGDAAMRTWRDESPYRWVGYYLPAPCYTGTSWQGKRATLRNMGWGIAVLFVGEQDWPAAAQARDTALAQPDPAGPRCTRTNLTTERARADAADAERTAAAEGFPAGTVIYLDVERVEEVSDSLRTYVRTWVETVAAGRFQPGLYAHAQNADALHAVAAEAVGGTAQAGSAVPLWVAKTGGFSLRRGPTESGFPAARVWQGLLDTDETWGGVAIRIDANVAASADPSG